MFAFFYSSLFFNVCQQVTYCVYYIMIVGLAQFNPITGDVGGNSEKIIGLIEAARLGSADLVVFPEMAITGYCVSDLIEDDDFVRSNLHALDRIAEKCTGGIAAVVGYVDFAESIPKRFNAAAVLKDGKIAGKAFKALLPNYRYFDDKRFFSPGKERNPIEIEVNGIKVKLGVSICEDMWADNYGIKPIEELVSKGAEILININASPFYFGKSGERLKLLEMQVEEFRTPIFYVNTVGAADNGKNIIPFDGHSLALDANGGLIGIGKKFESDLIFVDLNSGKTLLLESKSFEEETFDALVMGLKDYARKVGFSKAIESVSGGIDSALGLAIAVEAFGRENVKAFTLPSKFNSSLTVNAAEKVAKALGVEFQTIPIQGINDLVLREFESRASNVSSKVARENLQARIRGILMMLESNNSGALLVSNANKTEIALGYSTLYGDMCGGISVIGDLSKAQVYKIAKYVNLKFGREVIPRETFEALPSAELSEGQVDPFDYSIVSPIVDEFIESRKSVSLLVKEFKEKRLDGNRFEIDSNGKTVYEKHSIESFEKLVMQSFALFEKSVYKRLQGPPIIAVSKRAFGFDLRETLINGWNGK